MTQDRAAARRLQDYWLNRTLGREDAKHPRKFAQAYKALQAAVAKEPALYDEIYASRDAGEWLWAWWRRRKMREMG